MGTNTEFKCQIADCILLSFVYSYNQLPTALIQRKFFYFIYSYRIYSPFSYTSSSEILNFPFL